MITTHQKIQLKKLLGIRYGKQVLDILEQRKIYNKEGKPHTANYVHQILNGRSENFKIEEALFEVYKQRSDFIKNLEIARNQIL